ncbi:MAG TPA: hypothetical protein VNY78_04230 [Edaphobacter sp.]|nr:hypothetical protein [Edaphobacter sp.]
MKVGPLVCHCAASHGFGPADVDNNNDGERGDSCSGGPRESPAGKPGLAYNIMLCAQRFLHWRYGERYDGAAVRTDGKMGKRLLVLMKRQSMFNEGVELVRVWMMPGLKEVAHSGSDVVVMAEAVLSENVDV